ncbi:TRAM domain-containing protein, partial [Candidatus Bathyarchaeota archaeon]
HEPVALGEFVKVRVTDAHGGYLTGRTAHSISDKR